MNTVLERDAGVTLVEVCVAMAIVSTMALGAAQICAIALRAASTSRLETAATMLAIQKLEQLRSLPWFFDEAAGMQPVSDRSTDLSVDTPAGGGSGLGLSPSSSLLVNTPSYVDFLDSRGNWVGTGSAPPASAAFIRRWNVAALPANPADVLVLQVVVTPAASELRAGGAAGRQQGDARGATLATRKVR